MATKTQLNKAVAKFGGSIDWESSYITHDDKYIIIDAPDGKLWADSEASCICVSFYCGPASDFYDEAIARVNEGLL